VLLVAAALAQDRMAAVQLLDYEGLKSPPDSLLVGTFLPPFEEFTWTAEVVPSEGEYDLFAVRIQVRGRGEVFPSETLLHRPAPVLAVAGGGRGGAGGPGGGGAAGPGGGGRGRGGDQAGPGGGGRGRGGDQAGPGGGGRGRGGQPGAGRGGRGGGGGPPAPGGRGGGGRGGGGVVPFDVL
jgi:hypothetical protein